MIPVQKPIQQTPPINMPGVSGSKVVQPGPELQSHDGFVQFVPYTSPQMIGLLTSQVAAAGSVRQSSDRALKHDIAEVGRLPNGLKLYSYRYLWSDTAFVGVMAQDVARVDPDAVVRGKNGYLRVDYDRLGSRLQTRDEWARVS